MFFLCRWIHSANFFLSNENVGSLEFYRKDSNVLPSLLKGLRPHKSELIIFSSLLDDLWESVVDLGGMCTWCWYASTIFETPPGALLALVIAFTVLLAPTDLRWLPTVILFQFTHCLKVYYFFFVKVVVLKLSHLITKMLNIFKDENFRWFISSPW